MTDCFNVLGSIFCIIISVPSSNVNQVNLVKIAAHNDELPFVDLDILQFYINDDLVESLTAKIFSLLELPNVKYFLNILYAKNCRHNAEINLATRAMNVQGYLVKVLSRKMLFPVYNTFSLEC